ncbi:MAG: hypothetical protein ABT940_04665 [Alphaproteobacteria bacterium]
MPPKPMDFQPLTGQESLLLDYVQRLERHSKDRHAVHVHLSRLEARNRRPQRMRIAVNSFESLVRLLQGQIFALSNDDLIFIYKNLHVDEVESAIVKLQFMFADDLLLANASEGDVTDFATFYDLQKDYGELLKLAQLLLLEENERHAATAEPTEAETRQTRAKRTEPLTPALLARLEVSLAQADLSNLVRRQSICAIVGKSPPQPVFTELFVSIAELRDTILPNIDLASDRWLFQTLTDSLDRRVLSMLLKNDDRSLESDFSINLNSGSVVGRDFLKFDDNVKAGARSTIVLEIQVLDILVDLSAYLFARDFAHECGYRICVDGVTLMSLPFIGRDRLGADMLKLFWHPDMAAQAREDAGRFLKTMLRRNGLNRVILARCDNQLAVDVGQSLGITLFQGRHVEELLSAEAKKRGGPQATRWR